MPLPANTSPVLINPDHDIPSPLIHRRNETTAHCDADSLTDSYGLFVQLILAFLAFASLVVKRCLEPVKYRRPWMVWFFDTSKQATGAGFVHILNVFLAPLLSHQDPCTWYVVSFLLDSSLGIGIIFVCVKLIGCVARLKGYKTLRFGEYGNPPQCRPWFHQCLAFVLIVSIMKIIVTLVMQFQFWQNVRRVILSPIKNPKLEVTLVMLVIPFVLNTFMFWVVDTFTMQHSKNAMRPLAAAPVSGGIKNRAIDDDLADGADEKLLITQNMMVDEELMEEQFYNNNCHSLQSGESRFRASSSS